MPAGANLCRAGLCLLVFLRAGSFLAADFPRMTSLTPGDVVFRQFREDIARYNRTDSRSEPSPPLALYTYTPGEGEDIFFLAARLTLPLESLATLNGLDRSTLPVAGKALLVPGVPGIFMREKPTNTLERMLVSWRNLEEAQKLVIRGEVFYFYPGGRFHPIERIFFLNALFTFPLDSQVVTSRYGPRTSPVTGRAHFHSGLDLAAPRGSNVYAARAGIVTSAGYNDTLGNFIVLDHSGGFQTVYGHLESTKVELNQNVTSGMLIGSVGSTGASTGPHLHFEVREKGASRNPENFLPMRLKRREI